MDPATEPLLPTLFYEHHHRPYHDRLWRGAYLCMLAATLLAGLFSVFYNFEQLPILTNTSYLEDPANCPYPGPHPDPVGAAFITSLGPQRSLHQGPDDSQPPPSAWYLLQSSGSTLGYACSVAVALALCFSTLLRHSPGMAVAAALGLQTLMPLGSGMYLMYTGSPVAAYCCLALSAVLALCCYLNSDALGQLAPLLAVASSTLSSNLRLWRLSLWTKLTTLALVFYMACCCVVATLDGQAYPNPVRVPEAGVHCISPKGVLVQCCLWQHNTWPLMYVPVAVIAAAWTLLLGMQVEVFAVSDAIGQWYFRPVSSGYAPGCNLTALRHALGPSLGSLSLASLVLTAVAHVRLIFGRFTKQRQGQGVLGALGGCCMSCLLDMLHLLTKFTTVYMSMAGTDFFQSGRDAAELLHRTAAPCVGMWWLPPMVLQLPSLFIAVGLGCWAFATAQTQWGGLRPDTLLRMALALALLCGLLCWLVLSFTTSLLLLVLDALLLCYAADRDEGMCSQPQVHAAYSQLAAACASSPATSPQHHGPSHPIPLPLVLLPSDSFPYAIHHRGGSVRGEPYSVRVHSPPSSLGTPLAGSSHATLQGAWPPQPQPHSLSAYHATGSQGAYHAAGGLPPPLGSRVQQGVGAGQGGVFGSLAGHSTATMLYPPASPSMFQGSGSEADASTAAHSLPPLAPPSGLLTPPLGASLPQPLGHFGAVGMGVGSLLPPGAPLGRGMLMPLGPSPLAYTPSFQVPGNLAAEVPGAEDGWTSPS